MTEKEPKNKYEKEPQKELFIEEERGEKEPPQKDAFERQEVFSQKREEEILKEEEKKKTKVEEDVDALLKIAEEEGVSVAEKIAKKGDPLVLDLFRDTLVKRIKEEGEDKFKI